MLPNKYCNFVQASTSNSSEAGSHKETPSIINSISGEEAKRLYIEEVKDLKHPYVSGVVDEEFTQDLNVNKHSTKRRKTETPVSDKELFLATQNDDVDTVKNVLDSNPEKLHILDEFGWSLLMMACQGNSVNTVKLLLTLGADTSIRDKAGNSAQNLVIKNKNLQIAELLLSGVTNRNTKQKAKHKRPEQKLEYVCEICNKVYADKDLHLSSTIHNLNASKNKKIPTVYKIPETNKGFQIMLKTGWDKDSGLGYDGSGIKYPIKPVPKKDRKGLGHDKTKDKNVKVEDKSVCIKPRSLYDSQKKSRDLEIRFRREFY